MNRQQSLLPIIIGLLLVFLFACLVDPCDGAPDCRARTVQTK